MESHDFDRQYADMLMDIYKYYTPPPVLEELDGDGQLQLDETKDSDGNLLYVSPVKGNQKNTITLYIN